jgi:anti-sigma regulatory factor (Ser/Thr protein kinase)
MPLDDHIQHWTLPAETGSASVGRTLVAAAIGDSASIDDIILTTSELVTNAVKHGDGPVDLTLTHSSGTIRIEAASAFAGSEPTPRPAADDDPGGRGLALVEALASRWGWERRAHVLRVWAEFDRT